MNLTFLGGAGEVGRSSVLVESDRRMLLDYGVKLHGGPNYPLPFSGIAELAVISHAHLDHSGFFPQLHEIGATTIVSTPPTYELAKLLVEDSMRIISDLPYSKAAYKRSLRHFMTIPYGRKFGIGKGDVTLHDAGHITGAAMVEVRLEGKRLLYTGDYKVKGMRMHKGALLPEEGVDILMMESTYAKREHPLRQELEKQLAREIEQVVGEGGNVLMPAFAVGRSQEIIRAIRAFDADVPIFLDGMGVHASNIMLAYPGYVREPEGFADAMRSVRFVQGRHDRRKVLEKPGVVIATAGMLQGGPAMHYLLSLNRQSKIIFTGYSLEGTNGWKLVHEGKVDVSGQELKVETPVEYLDFSAHAGRGELLETVKKSGAEKIFCMHGDNCEGFAEELRGMGFDAVAPKLGESFEVK